MKKSKNIITKKELKKQKAFEKAQAIEKSGKKLSWKHKEILRLKRTKLIYKNQGEYSLRLKNVKKSFGSKFVLNGVNFDIKKGEKLSLIGKNGSGKSTLINIISQQSKMTEGEIRYGYAKNRVESLELLYMP